MPLLARLLTVAALCSLAACQSLVIEGSDFEVKLEDSNEALGPKSILRKLSLIAVQCTMRAMDNRVLEAPSITWTKEGSNASLDSRYDTLTMASIDGRNFTSMLRLRRPMNEDITNYTCSGTAKNLDWEFGTARMLSRPLIVTKVGTTKTFDISVWPGDTLMIACQAEGNPTGSVEWHRKGCDGALVMLQNTSVLNLTELSYEDRGYLTCRSENKFGANSAQIFLRVKNSKAYLTPLIIILIEAVVLGAVIAAYEVLMRRKRASQMESEQSAAYKVD